FYEFDRIDPAAAAASDNAWLDIRAVLLRWAEGTALAPELEDYLSGHLPRLIETALERVVREPQHTRAWIAWQEAFARQSAAEHRQILEGVRAVAAAVGEVKTMLERPAVRREPSPEDVEGYLIGLWNHTRHIEIKNLRVNDASANVF